VAENIFGVPFSLLLTKILKKFYNIHTLPSTEERTLDGNSVDKA
jgi:hypothetical protein